MARTKVDVCNQGLSELGSDTITTFPEDSVIGRLCNRFYDPTVEEELREHNWNFSLERQALNQDTATPIGSEYAYQYALPTDPYCLRVIRMLGKGADSQKYKIEGRKLLTDSGEVSIQYVREIEDPNQFDSLFSAAVSLQLAKKMCIPITNDKPLKTDMEKAYDKVIAKAQEANEIESEQPGVPNTDWESEGR